MLKVRFFRTSRTLKTFHQIGRKNEIGLAVTAKPKAEYETDEYFALDLPLAPAAMVGEDILAEGTEVGDHDLEACICRHFELPEPERKGLLDRLLKR